MKYTCSQCSRPARVTYALARAAHSNEMDIWCERCFGLLFPNPDAYHAWLAVCWRDRQSVRRELLRKKPPVYYHIRYAYEFMTRRMPYY